MPSALAVFRLITRSDLVGGQDRQVGWPLPAENAARIDTSFSKNNGNVGTIGNQPAYRRKFANGYIGQPFTDAKSFKRVKNLPPGRRFTSRMLRRGFSPGKPAGPS